MQNSKIAKKIKTFHITMMFLLNPFTFSVLVKDV